MTTRTAKQARVWLDYLGITIAQWARDNGFSETLVHEVLTGRRRCRRGQSHNIAVALGMKAGRPTNRPARVPPAKHCATSTSIPSRSCRMNPSQIIVRHCADRHGQPLLVLERLPLAEDSELYPEMARAYARVLLQAADDCEDTRLSHTDPRVRGISRSYALRVRS